MQNFNNLTNNKNNGNKRLTSQEKLNKIESDENLYTNFEHSCSSFRQISSSNKFHYLFY